MIFDAWKRKQANTTRSCWVLMLHLIAKRRRRRRKIQNRWRCICRQRNVKQNSEIIIIFSCIAVRKCRHTELCMCAIAFWLLTDNAKNTYVQIVNRKYISMKIWINKQSTKRNAKHQMFSMYEIWHIRSHEPIRTLWNHLRIKWNSSILQNAGNGNAYRLCACLQHGMLLIVWFNLNDMWTDMQHAWAYNINSSYLNEHKHTDIFTNILT